MDISRRNFVSGLSSSLALGAVSGCINPPPAKVVRKDGELIWCMYQQLGSHMWHSGVKFPLAANGHFCGEKTHIDDASWERRMAACAKNGVNMLCIDLAEGLRYPSHPELALEGSRSPEWMNDRVRRLRDMGIEAVPSLNFSAAHNYWLGFWSRRISTPEYYRTISELLADAYDIFEKPSMMNFGMDEENEDCTKRDYFSSRRQGDLLWHDIDFYAKTISKLGARPWMWSDYEWWRSADYVKRVSKEIMQTNWYYGFDFDYKNMKGIEKTYVESYVRLEKAGFDQMPGCSNYVGAAHTKAGRKVNTENIPGTVEFAKREIAPSRLKGFYCMPWVSTNANSDPTWVDSCNQLGAAKKKYFG